MVSLFCLVRSYLLLTIILPVGLVRLHLNAQLLSSSPAEKNMSTIYIRTVLDNKLRGVDANTSVDLAAVFRYLVQTYPNDFKHLKTQDPVFQQLITPVRFGDTSVEDVINECLKEDNWATIRAQAILEDFAPKLDSRMVYFIITLSDDRAEAAIKELTENFPKLYKRLQVKVGTMLSWKNGDIALNGGILNTSGTGPPILRRLQQKRTYHENENEPRQAAAKQHPVGFNTMFKKVPAQNPVVATNRIEFTALDIVLDCYKEYAPEHAAGTNGSSSVKASSFKVPFMHLPFYACYPDSSYSYQEEVPWEFPIFLSAAENEFRKYTPSSSISIIFPEYLCPVLIANIVSNDEKTDRLRMLIHGTALARVGQYFMKSKERKFCVFVVYIDKRLVAHRYILYESENYMEDSDLKEVEIFKEKFDLKHEDRAAEFLKEMFNLVDIVKEFAGDLDDTKMEYLAQVCSEASDIPSLYSTQSSTPRRKGNGTIDEDPQDSDPFNSEEVDRFLRSRGYRIELEVPGHPHITMVSQYDEDGVAAYLKFVEEGYDEADILEYLSEFKSPKNHTIGLIEVWPLLEGSIIVTQDGGFSITSLENPSKYLWPTLQQLFEGVQFMHDRGVAHMDLKPNNIVIPVRYGRLQIIDYNLAVHVDDDSQEFTSRAGTKGYIAPEVGKGPYNPIRADLWSCGKVVEVFCLRCDSSSLRDRLLEVSRLLMNDDPMKRPMMKDVLDLMSLHDAEGPSTVSGQVLYTDANSPPNIK